MIEDGILVSPPLDIGVTWLLEFGLVGVGILSRFVGVGLVYILWFRDVLSLGLPISVIFFSVDLAFVIVPNSRHQWIDFVQISFPLQIMFSQFYVYWLRKNNQI